MEQRNVSGIYFRTQVDGKWVNRVFEDLSEEEQDRQLENRTVEWLKSLSKQLAQTLRKVCDQFDIAND